MDDSAEIRYNGIIGKYGLNLKVSERIIEGGDRQFEVFTTPMINVGTSKLKNLNTDNITLEEYFVHAKIEK